MSFRFRLAQVQKLRERDRDTAADALGQARLAATRLQEEIERLQQEHADQGPFQAQLGKGTVSPQRILESQQYQAHLVSQIAELRSQLRLVEGEIEKRRQLLVKREQAVQSMEKLHARQREEWEAEAERQNQIAMDEWAGFHYWKEQQS